jgi:hypothetical protein
MNGSFRSALTLSLAIVLSAFIISSSYLKAKRLDQTIRVTGSSKKRIKSDLMIWRTSLTAESTSLADAYAKLSRNVEKTKAFLVSQGFPENQVIASAVTTITIRSSRGTQGQFSGDVDASGGAINGRVSGYSLKQSLEISSSEIDKLTVVSRQVTQLINQGILLESEEPQYLYTKLAEMKVAILAEASRDAKERAQQIAASTGSKIGEIRSAEMSVFQITAPNSNEMSGYGVNDTKSLEKDISAVVHVTFAVE